MFVDEKAGFLLFTASGKEADRNPYFQHAYRVNLDGSGLRLLTPENANHDVSVSPDGKYMTDNVSAYNLATRSVLRETKTGKILRELAQAYGRPEAGYSRLDEPVGKETFYGGE